ncbi:MAG: hypothetical protein GY791_01445 [Alphaproteobacteria bacterium]|nr:hypothetical protein [Alphaproteobacteria bacterium]
MVGAVGASLIGGVRAQDSELVAESVSEALREIVAGHFEIDPSSMQESTSFAKGLGATSDDMAALRQAINDEFGLELTGADLAKVKTIRQTRDLIIERLP